MKKFFICYNNGVTALVSEEVKNDLHKQYVIWQNFAEREKDEEYTKRWRAATASEATRHLKTPIFTFVQDERFKKSPWFTGNDELLEMLCLHIKECGWEIEEGSFFVPFSNGCEIGLHGKDSMKSELAQVTTEQQFRETFGLTTSALKSSREVGTYLAKFEAATRQAEAS